MKWNKIKLLKFTKRTKVSKWNLYIKYIIKSNFFLDLYVIAKYPIINFQLVFLSSYFYLLKINKNKLKKKN